MAVFSSGMQMTQGGVHPVGRDRPGQEMVKMGKSFLARVPMPVKLGVPVAAAGLLAAACSSAAGTSGSSAPASSGTSAGSATGTVIATQAGSGGTFLTEGGRTVYLWVKDGMNKTTCTGACASAWPPVMDKGQLTASGGAKAADLGTIARPGGGKQVTYNGHALYFFAGDSSAGQTSGQGSDSFGAKWWLVAPAGSQITASDTAASSSSGGSSSGGSSASGSSSGGSWG
jgi:predicted lipoprotein with Yx(FWY)xxD motif